MIYQTVRNVFTIQVLFIQKTILVISVFPRWDFRISRKKSESMVNVKNIPVHEYRLLINQYSFDKYPRSFGNPKQYNVFDWNSLYKNIILNNGKKTCFISHNRWGTLKNINGKELPVQVWYDTLFFDFDDSRKPENSQLDTIKLIDFLEQFSLPHIVQFSGSKGFHVFLYFKPKLFEYRKEDDTERNMNIFIRSIFRWFKTKLSLKTLDDTVGEPKKLCRLPYTYHVNRKGEVHEEQCVPLSNKQIHDWDIDTIRKYSRNPDFVVPSVNSINYDVISFVDKFDVKLNENDGIELDNSQFNLKSHGHIKNKELKIYMDLVSKYKPCIVSNLQTMNPDHFTRVAFALYMKRMGISKHKFTELYEALANENKYIDFYVGTEIREYQINHIFDNPDYRYEPSCDTIKQNHPHLCLREKCHRYIPNYKRRKKPQPVKSTKLVSWRK